MLLQQGVFSLEPRLVFLFPPQLRHFPPQPMQLGHVSAKPLQFVRVSSKARELLVALAERFKLLRSFSKFLVLHAQAVEGFLLNHERSSGADNDSGTEEPCL